MRRLGAESLDGPAAVREIERRMGRNDFNVEAAIMDGIVLIRNDKSTFLIHLKPPEKYARFMRT